MSLASRVDQTTRASASIDTSGVTTATAAAPRDTVPPSSHDDAPEPFTSDAATNLHDTDAPDAEPTVAAVTAAAQHEPAPQQPHAHVVPHATEHSTVDDQVRITRLDSVATTTPSVGAIDRDVVRRIVGEVRDAIGDIPDRTRLSDDRLRALVEQQTTTVLSSQDEQIDRGTVSAIRRAVADELLGFGPLQALLDRDDVSEIMVNGHQNVFVERSGRLEPADTVFESEEQLLLVIERMVRTSGRRVDQSSPMVDARLPDGSRLNVVLPPLAVDGPSITIRKFTARHLTSAELVAHGAMGDDAAALLRAAVERRMNVIVSGGTGTGKTTMLNVLSSHIGRTERVVTVEDAVELTLDLPNLIRLEARPANTEGAGEVTIRDLVRNSLRMRPDRIVVGEVRGAEALDMLQAMNTGHDGSLSTVHANSPRDAVRRLETMVLFGGIDLPLRAIREQIASAVDLVVQLTRMSDGRRVVSSITEVVGLEGDVVSTADLFTRRTTDAGDELVPTGVTSRALGAVKNTYAAAGGTGVATADATHVDVAPIGGEHR